MNYFYKEEILYKGMMQNAYEVLKSLNLDTRNYRHYRTSGLLPQQAFDKVLWEVQHYEKRTQPSHYSCHSSSLESLIQRGMPSKFRSLNHFCIKYKIDYDSFLRILNKYPQFTFSKAIKYYLRIDYVIGGNNSNSYYGIALQAICLKFQLDYNFCTHRIKQGVALEDTLDEAIYCSPIFPEKVKLDIASVAPCIRATAWEDLEVFREIFDGETMKYVYFYHKRSSDLKEALTVYSIVNFFENEWESLYVEEIRSLYADFTDSVTFFQKYNDLKKRARKELLEEAQMTSEELQSYYNEYYQDYILVQTNEEKVWGYNRKKLLYN